ncbi:MAG: hypothetical protein NVS9B1_15880 [Candidatus Dormibacteraceae bacterium]
MPAAFRRITLAVATLALIALPGSSAAAAPAPVRTPEHPATGYGGPVSHHRDSVALPPAVRTATVAGRAGTTTPGAGSGVVPFLTRPYWGWHSLNSWFDHCNPDYTVDGKICTVDGTVALASNGRDPYFTKGYAVTPGGHDYIYYDGHNGYDLGLSYEELLAAAPGVVTTAGIDPVSYNSCYGLTVVIDHGNGFSTRYAHMSQVDVAVGQTLYRGQHIGVSGTTGCSTGPHLHFSVYVTSSWTVIDAWGWLGSGTDPWPYDQGDLWISGNPLDPIPGAPTAVTATALGQTVTVNWAAPAFDGGSGVSTYTVIASPGGQKAVVDGSHLSTTIAGLSYGTAYTFTVTAASQAGTGAVSAPSNPISPAPPNVLWFPWYDRYSPGMWNDNIHVVNPGSAATTGRVIMPGQADLQFALDPGAETVLTFPPGVLGGPVQVQSNLPVVASQRVQFNQSFNEIAAGKAANACTTCYFTWYDNASPGMLSDNVHLVNPGALALTGTVSMPGQVPIPFSIGPGLGTFVAFPSGTIGGPVTIAASQPVLASQRVMYNQSFDEVLATPAAAAAKDVYFNWYDRYSPGMWNDNVHILNPGLQPVSGTVSAGSLTVPFQIAGGAQTIVAIRPGTLGGPVHVAASGPVIAAQRVQFNQSFNEVPGAGPGAATTTSWFPWYDIASAGMVSTDLHVMNVGTAPANVKFSLANGTPLTLIVPAGAEGFVNYPRGTIGGPVAMTSDQPVIPSIRVIYYGSFSERLGSNP